MATTTADVHPAPDPAPEPDKDEAIDPALIDQSNGKVRANLPIPNPQEQAAKAKKK